MPFPTDASHRRAARRLPCSASRSTTLRNTDLPRPAWRPSSPGAPLRSPSPPGQRPGERTAAARPCRPGPGRSPSRPRRRRDLAPALSGRRWSSLLRRLLLRRQHRLRLSQPLPRSRRHVPPRPCPRPRPEQPARSRRSRHRPRPHHRNLSRPPSHRVRHRAPRPRVLPNRRVQVAESSRHPRPMSRAGLAGSGGSRWSEPWHSSPCWRSSGGAAASPELPSERCPCR